MEKPVVPKLDRADLAKFAKSNPKVDLDLILRARAEMADLGLKPATYNLKGAFSRRTD